MKQIIQNKTYQIGKDYKDDNYYYEYTGIK